MELKEILSWWPVLISSVLAIVFITRLEMKIKSSDKEIKLNKEIFCNHMEVCQDQRDIMNRQSEKTIERIEKAVDELFKIVREVQSTVNELKGWRNGISTIK